MRFFILTLIAFMLQNSPTQAEEGEKNLKKDPLKVASQLIEMRVTPPYKTNFDWMTKGVIQHLDQKYTYDIPKIIPQRWNCINLWVR